MAKKYNYTKKTGRPTKYTKDFVLKLAEKLKTWIEVPSNFWLGTFAYENGMDRHRLAELANKFPEFMASYLCAKQNQENKLFLGAITKKLDAFMVHNALKNVSGWRPDGALVDQSKHTHYVIYRNPQSIREEAVSKIPKLQTR